MKKRTMKKYIPKNTVYCGKCRWRHFLGTICLHRNPEDFPNNPVEKCDCSDTCEHKCWTGGSTNCMKEIWKCDYLGLIDKKQDSLLWDGCKECGVHYPKDCL